MKEYGPTVIDHYYGNGLLYGYYHLDEQIRGPHGHAFWNYPNGMRMVDGYYNKGIRAGRWRWFSEDGEVINIHDFGEGEYQKTEVVTTVDLTECCPENTIMLDEEDGYRNWFWQPDRSIEDTIIWWSSLEAICPWSYSPVFLPGNMVEVTTSEYYDFWIKSWHSGRFVTGHISEDYDSYLRRPSGKEGYPSGDVIRHKNYKFVEEWSYENLAALIALQERPSHE